MNENGYRQYKEQSVMTMTKGELLILLYDELLKRLKRAELALDTKNYVLFEQSAGRSVEIVQYLKDTLNYEYTLSRELSSLYDFFLYELSRLKAGRKKEIIRELQPLIKNLRDTFAEAEKAV